MTLLRKYFLVIIATLIPLLFFLSCEYGFDEVFYRKDGIDKRIGSIKDYTLTLSFPNQVKAMIIADPQMGLDYGSIPKAAFYNFVTVEQPDMILVLGDIVDHGWESEYQEYKKFIDDIPTHIPSGAKIPVYSVVGNHDLYNSGWNLYQKYVTPDSNFYRIKTGDVSWYFVDSASGTLGKKQLDILEKEFSQDENYKFVFSHYPFYGYKDLSYFTLSNSRERAFLLNLCAKSKVQGIYSGHVHSGGNYDFGPFYEKIVSCLRGYEELKPRWVMLDVNLATNTYTQTEYEWDTGDNYNSIATINYTLD